MDRRRRCRRLRNFPQFGGLPPEVQVSIMEHLPVNDLLSLRRTSKDIWSLSHNCQLWKEKFCRSWFQALPEDQRHLIEKFIRRVMSIVVSSDDRKYWRGENWDPPWHRQPSWAFLWSLCGKKPHWALICLPFLEAIRNVTKSTRETLDFLLVMHKALPTLTNSHRLSLHYWNTLDEMGAYCRNHGVNVSSPLLSSLIDPMPPYIMWTIDSPAPPLLLLQHYYQYVFDQLRKTLWPYLPKGRWFCVWFLELGAVVPRLEMFVFDGRTVGYQYATYDHPKLGLYTTSGMFNRKYHYFARVTTTDDPASTRTTRKGGLERALYWPQLSGSCS